ncbi:hypothetical protein BOTNAR_0305g00150 [Botryotinia narcissicola]|uniref:Uncharacterized protein n=1 Tax=Botryotinia narcissicola TaxID=278944 RepID=A0A4Z1I0X4_9HELO|nr:hypothetical protein BOTNAR_0305g00150 [Botryotinia narcissicola]
MDSESYNSQSNSKRGSTGARTPISKWFEDSHQGDIIYENNHRGPTAHFTHRTPPYRGGNLDRGRSSNRSRGSGLLESFRSKGSQSAPRGGQQTAPYNPPQVNRDPWQQAHMEARIRFGPIEQQYGPSNVLPPPSGFPQTHRRQNAPSRQLNSTKRGNES